MNDLFIVIIKFIPGSSDMECYERAKYLLETGVNKTLQQSFMQILLIYLDLKSRRLFQHKYSAGLQAEDKKILCSQTTASCS